MSIARATFFISAATTLFWVFGFAAEGLFNSEPPFWSYSAAAFVVSSVLAFGLFRAWPLFLSVAPGSVGHFVRGAAIWSAVSYLVGAVIVGGLAYLLMVRGSHVSEALRGEATLAAYMLAFWLPLWFSPAIGLSLAWWKSQSNMRSNIAVKRDAPQAVRPLP